jgi:cytochrome c oxidase subunit 2
MQFEVVAEDPAQFKEWLQQQARPAVEPSNPQEAQGRQVFLSGPCSMCHAIRGTQALAQVGPDLTHMATRRWIAAGTLPNNRGSRGGWIVNAQGIKPGNHMPRLNLESNDLQALLDYLASLQ